MVRLIFEAVPVSDLPPPHNVFKCAHADRFQEFIDAHEQRGEDSDDASERAGRALLKSLTTADRGACRFHNARWKAIAEESVRILDTLGNVDSELYVREANRAWLNKADRHWLESLFAVPLTSAVGLHGRPASCVRTALLWRRARRGGHRPKIPRGSSGRLDI